MEQDAHRVRPLGEPFTDAIQAFVGVLVARNRSEATIRAYSADLRQFFHFVTEVNVAATEPARVERVDVIEYLSALGANGISGMSRARKLAAIREFYRSLQEDGTLDRSPADGVRTPRKERNVRTYLTPEEYSRMLSLAGANPRDYALLQTFLQTGVRVSELCALATDDVDFPRQTLRVHGKGLVEREIELERKGLAALRNWLNVRPGSTSDRLFLNRDGDPISDRGVRKLVAKYRGLAGITRRASCHSFRHTFATHKAEHGVSPFQLQRWLGHASLATTQIYVHLGRQRAKKLMEATSL